MPLQIDGRTPGELRVARDDGSLATVGEARVWDDGRWKTIYESWRPRTFLIDGRGTGTTWDKGTARGDIDLWAPDIYASIKFVEDVICDKDTDVNRSRVLAGDRISAGDGVLQYRRNSGTHTFTSVR